MSLLIGGVVGVTASAAYYFTKQSAPKTNNREPAPIATTIAALDVTIQAVAQNASNWVEVLVCVSYLRVLFMFYFVKCSTHVLYVW